MKMKHVANRRRSVSSRAFIALLALVLVIGCVAGGTVAWLVATSDTVTNTFTYGDINITLAETTGEDYKIIPGKDIPKDPKVTVTAGSEACWLFVKVEESGTFVADKVTYAIDKDWTALEGEKGVYYRKVAAVTADTDFSVLEGNKITVKDTLTKGDIKDIAATNPTLTFTAYAVQQENIPDAATAWKAANPTTTTNPSAIATLNYLKKEYQVHEEEDYRAVPLRRPSGGRRCGRLSCLLHR